MEKKLSKITCVCVGLSFLSGLNSWSNDAHVTSVDQFDYPELNVVPRASDRIHSEAAEEMNSGWTYYLPMQASALTTLVAGITCSDPFYQQSGTVGILVGGSLLIASSILAARFHPYDAEDREISQLPQGSTREKLTRERAAESAIHNIASLEARIKWISVAANLGASVYMLATGNGSKGINTNGVFYPNFNPNNLGIGFAAASAAMAFMPVIFHNHWGGVSDEQNDFRKRIYAPVAHASFYTDPTTQKTTPGIGMTFFF